MSYKILVVDDEPDLQLLISQRFRTKIKSGEFNFDFALNGVEALDKLKEENGFQVMLTDINMPVMDGLTLLNKLIENEIEIKSVVVSAYGDMSNVRTAMNRGAFDFVVKPIDMNDLETTLNKTLKDYEVYKEGREAKAQLIETLKEKEHALIEKNEAQQHVIELMAEKEKMILHQNEILEQKVIERTHELVAEKKKSDDLLNNILPEEVAGELKQNGFAKAKSYRQVTVLFTDFVNFTGISSQLSPEDLVSEIDTYYKAFDEIIDRNGLEKIKTIGDSYMAACGLPVEVNDHATKAVKAAIEISDFIKKHKAEGGKFDLRIGLNSGAVVAGIVGNKKFAYDIWGDTVNVASRMESNSEPGRINISGSTYELIKNEFGCEYRGKIPAKNKGDIDMYFVVSAS